jgi:hypothetical protein
MKYYTYAYLREDRTPYYIGKGKGNRAYGRRYKGIKPPKDKSRILILKQNLTEQDAFKHEVYMIAAFGRKDLGTGILHNRTDGGDGSSGLVHNEESKRKMSEAAKGRNHLDKTKRKISETKKGRSIPPFSEEHKRKISEAKKNMSEETKRKMSEAHKNMSEETKRKISEARKGKPLSEETKRKMSEQRKGENNHMFGKTHNEETKKKLSELKIGRKWWNDGSGNIKSSLDCPGDGWVLGRIK